MLYATFVLTKIKFIMKGLHSQTKDDFVSDKAKGKISKWRQQENKTRQIFRKMTISYP